MEGNTGIISKILQKYGLDKNIPNNWDTNIPNVINN
jgi:hypothetical protein